jgi:lysozyme
MAVGFNCERDGANEAMRKAGVNPDVVWAAIEEAKKSGRAHTGQIINHAQSAALLDADLAECVADLRINLFPDFYGLPEPARLVLVDMRYQLGPTRLRQFKNTLKAFRERRWNDAAEGIRASAMYKQVPKRCDENIALLRGIPGPV